MQTDSSVARGDAQQSPITTAAAAAITPANKHPPTEHTETFYPETADFNIKEANMEAMRVVLPGDRIQLDGETNNTETMFIGPGLRWQEGVVYATKPGRLRVENRNLYYVDSHQKRFIPQKGEFVIGIITKKKGDNYLINIAASECATLSDLVFENNAKKARTHLKPGDLIFGKLLEASKDKEPELVPIDVVNCAVGIASLPDNGVLFHVPLHVARQIAIPGNSLLEAIAQKIDYTIVVGYNGRVWLKSRDLNNVVTIMNFVMMLEVLTRDEVVRNVHAALGSSA